MRFCWSFRWESHHYPTPPGGLAGYSNFMIYFWKQKASPTLDSANANFWALSKKSSDCHFARTWEGRKAERTWQRESGILSIFVRDSNERHNVAGSLPRKIFREAELLWTCKEITISCSLAISVFKAESLGTFCWCGCTRLFFFFSLFHTCRHALHAIW